MYYAVGPVLALLISMKFNQISNKKTTEELVELQARVEKVEKITESLDKETLKKMLVTVSPIAKAVKELQEAVGVQ